MLPFELVVVVVAFFGNIFLALFTYFKNPKSVTNRLFFIFSVIIAVYVLFNYSLLHQATNQETLFWVRMVMFIALLLNLSFFLLVSVFPRQKLQIKPSILIFSILSTLLLLPLTQTNLIFKAVIVKGNNIESIPGNAMPLFLIHTLIFLGGGFLLLIKKFRTSVLIEKKQIKLFLMGAIFMFVSILITNLLFVLVFNNSTFVGFLPLYTLIFIGFISYAIVKHKFLDINLLVARTVAYALIITIIGGFYSAIFFLISSIIFSIPFSLNQFLFYGFIALVIAFTFQPIRKIIEKNTESVLYKGYYDEQELLKSLSLIMSTTIELEKLTSSILQQVTDTLKITTGAFVLLEKKDKQYIDYIQAKGYKVLPSFHTEEINIFFQNKRMIIFDDLEEGTIKDEMRKLKIAVVLSIHVKDDKFGYLFFGEKASGSIFSQQDINLFDILAPQLSIAIQNAREYEEIRHFNITLREEIDKATKELQAANQQLQQLDKLKDEFVSLASHELRTPMTAIKSYLWMALAGKGGPLTEKQKYYLDRSYNSTDRLIKLVNDMLNVSRIESGRIKLEITPIQLEKTINDIIFEITPRAEELGVNVLFVNPSVPLPQVMADSDKIKEVLINLIGNSLKFTPKDGQIKIIPIIHNNMVLTEVQDNGKGIKLEDISKLFQKFGIVGNSNLTKQNAQGTGLGLYITKSLIELHGGKIWANSEGENKGTSFYFTLPIVK